MLNDHSRTLFPSRPNSDYSGHTLGSEIEAPLVTREILLGTHFLSVIMAAGALAERFLHFQASCLWGTLYIF
jgi:hypothetical protein